MIDHDKSNFMISNCLPNVIIEVHIVLWRNLFSDSVAFQFTILFTILASVVVSELKLF